jgi:hypothetical protein
MTKNFRRKRKNIAACQKIGETLPQSYGKEGRQPAYLLLLVVVLPPLFFREKTGKKTP